jgi:hypothetical protein
VSRTLVVCHDAGGAEVVSAWVRRRADPGFVFLLEGPATAVFERKLGKLRPLGCDDALAAIAERRFELVLTGSSWSSDLEARAVRASRAAGVRCATYLDHWMRYPERFARDGRTVLPDEVWVGDDHAEAIARRTLPGADVRLVPNAYLEDVVAAIGAEEQAERDAERRALYVTEPTRRAALAYTGDERGYGYDEVEALAGYLERVDPSTRVRVRPHPSEEPGKYDEVIAAHATRVRVEGGAGSSLEQDIAWADEVVGCDSMAMAVGVAAGRRVICAIPPGGRPPSLPFPQIERLYGDDA